MAVTTKNPGAAAKPAATEPSMVQILRPDGSADAALDPKLPAEELKTLYRYMLQLRIFDTRMLLLQRSLQ